MGGLFSKKFNPSTDLLDLNGKVVIVTGGNAGIGYATVKHLARRGAKVYLAARNESKATGAIASLEAEGVKPGQVIWLKLNLSDPREAKKAGEEFLSREKRLDVLVNNAAVLVDGNTVTKSCDGIVDSMMVNHIGPFVFTQTVLPLLNETAKEPDADVRIVNVASDGHKYVPSDVRFRNVEDFNVAYEKADLTQDQGATKLANVLWTNELQKQLTAAGTQIVALSLHPGAHPDQGAYTSIIAAASPDIRANPEKYKGVYLTPVGKLTQPSATARNPELAAELWATTEKILEDAGVQ